MRILSAFLMLVLAVPAMSGESPVVPRPGLAVVDLDAPHRMETLARENPEHHAKVLRMMAEARFQPVKQIPGWMKTTFNADDIEFPAMLYTSNPGQRRLVFTLDGTRYAKFVYFPSATKPEPVMQP
jgi:hypothetical protein